MKSKKNGTSYLMLLLAVTTVNASVAVASISGDPEAGAGLAMVCQACHGPGGNSMIPTMYPSLAARDASELAALLQAYRDGEKVEPQMSPQAQGLTDQEIKDLAAFFAIQEKN